MAELDEQIHIEDNSLDVGEGEEAPPPPPQASIMEAFQHFACLYIKYLQIMQRLEQCLDAMVHPQKRIDVKMVLELVIRRVLELKNELVKWNPPNPDLQLPLPAQEEGFPWEYINLDDILVDLKLPPETLDVPVPRYFREDSAAEISARDKLVLGYMQLKHGGTQGMQLGEEEDQDAAAVANMTLDRAIEIIQRNERGRQGKQRAIYIKEMREDEKRRHMYDATEQVDMDSDIAAANIQRLFRGCAARHRAKREREDELVYIGMKPPPYSNHELEHELNIAYVKRKQEQVDNKEGYEKALDDLRDLVIEEEGPEIREQFRGERTLWVTDQISQDNFPDDLVPFYLLKNPPPVEAPSEPEGKGKKGGKGKDKDKKDAKDKKDKKDKKGEGGKKGKKGKGDDEPAPVERPPPLQGKSALGDSLYAQIQRYEGVWATRDETDNFAQRHDVGLAKDIVRPGVMEELRLQVDEMLLLNLKKIKAQVQQQEKGKKGKKGKAGKKGKGKKGKKGKDKKGKKGKGLPGDKLSELKGLDTDQMLSSLVESKIVMQCRPRRVADLVGDFNYLGTIQQHADIKGKPWTPPDPSMAQLRQLITEYCILPIGSSHVKANLKPEAQIKTVMLYGAPGTGKTMMVEAVAHELGALLLNLSPGRLKGQFTGKTGPTKLIHMAFAVARDMGMAPVVIYIDECETVFAGGGKKAKGADKDGPSRFKKDLITYRNLALQPEDRVIIIGTSSRPELGDPKELRSFFDKFLHMPMPDYASRLMLWGSFVGQALSQASSANVVQRPGYHARDKSAPLVPTTASIPTSLDLSALAQVSTLYSAGSIYNAVKKTLTLRRVNRMSKRSLLSSEFLGALSREPQLLKRDVQEYQDFTAKITGLEDRRQRIKDAREAEKAGDEKGDKKGKKAPKKK